MQRRIFIKSLAATMFGFVVLPPATTYQRVWRAERVVAPVTTEDFIAFLLTRLPAYEKLLMEDIEYSIYRRWKKDCAASELTTT